MANHKEFRLLSKKLRKRGFSQISDGNHPKFGLRIDDGRTFVLTVTRSCRSASDYLTYMESNLKKFKNRVKMQNS